MDITKKTRLKNKNIPHHNREIASAAALLGSNIDCGPAQLPKKNVLIKRGVAKLLNNLFFLFKYSGICKCRKNLL